MDQRRDKIPIQTKKEEKRKPVSQSQIGHSAYLLTHKHLVSRIHWIVAESLSYYEPKNDAR